MKTRHLFGLLVGIGILSCSGTGYHRSELMQRSRGTLIFGGGKVPEEVYQDLVEVMKLSCATEGSEGSLRLVVIPTASGVFGGEETDEEKQREAAQRLCDFWARVGVSEVKILHAGDRSEALDPDFSAPLRQAHVVWFTGGHQGRLKVYCDTPVQRELHAVLDRGGIVGGTSAGTAIMSTVMIERLVEGSVDEPLLSRGLGLVEEILDQHFEERKREPRLLKALQLPGNEHRAGIGVNEGTAVIWPINRGLGGAYCLGQSCAYYYPSSLSGSPRREIARAVWSQSAELRP